MNKKTNDIDNRPINDNDSLSKIDLPPDTQLFSSYAYNNTDVLKLINHPGIDIPYAASIDAVYNCKQSINSASKGTIVVFDIPTNLSDKEKSPALLYQDSTINNYQYSPDIITQTSKIQYIPRENKKQRDTVMLYKMDEIIKQYHGRPKFKVADLHSLLAISPRGLQRKVKQYKGVTPSFYLRDFRLKKAKFLLSNGHRVSKVAVDVGFKSQSYFSNCFRKKYGVTPKVFQARFMES